MTGTPSLKLQAARTLKWNSIDRLCSQVLYGVVGIVLANVVSKEDFGLVGVILMFQAFAVLFVDSGFGTALLQKKEPTQTDYSTVFWFNLSVATGIYWILWFCAPVIATLFHGDLRLIPMSRVMFLAFIFTALGIIQTNRLMKLMSVKQVALSNLVSQTMAGGLGVGLALGGFGAWALVWQGVAQAAVKSLWLWAVCSWRPSWVFSRQSLKSIIRVGSSVFGSSFLNTLCLNVYTFIIGVWYPLRALGVYTQADKWSKMGYASLQQIFNATFVPLLSNVQDQRERFLHMIGKINRMSAFITFPFMGGLIVMAAPIFHLLFGNKWDEAIPLFRILAARGIFVVLTQLLANHILSLGRAKRLFTVEVVKDFLLVGAIFATIPFKTIEALVWGQMLSSVFTFVYVLITASAATGYQWWRYLSDFAPYAFLTVLVMLGMSLWTWVFSTPVLLVLVEALSGLGAYYLILRLTGSVALRDSLEYLLGRFKKKK